MTKTMLSLALCGSLAAGLTLSAPAAEATPGGCLKYGAAGALAGHAVHHGVKGFLAGCAAGMYRRHLYNKSVRDQKKIAPTPAAASGTPPAAGAPPVPAAQPN